MFNISIIYSDLSSSFYEFDDVYDCLDYLYSLFTHFSEYHPGVPVNFVFSYKPKEVLEDVQS